MYGQGAPVAHLSRTKQNNYEVFCCMKRRFVKNKPRLLGVCLLI
jgi:hypothetical protein